MAMFRRSRAYQTDKVEFPLAAAEPDGRMPETTVVLFPPELTGTGLKGRVIVEAIVSGAGSVGEVAVIESSHPLLSRAAVASIELWRFPPLINNGAPVTSRVRQTIDFYAY